VRATLEGDCCKTPGVWGKDQTAAPLQDPLILAIKGILMYARAARLGASDPELDACPIQAMISTLTNVSFDVDRMVGLIHQAAATRDAACADAPALWWESLAGAPVGQLLGSPESELRSYGRESVGIQHLARTREDNRFLDEDMVAIELLEPFRLRLQ